MLTRAANAEPAKPGEVRLQERHPLRLLAVVHDLEQQPSCRLSWIESAIQELLRIVALRRVQALALPLLGTVHAVRSPRPVARLLGVALARPPATLRRVWLQIAPPAEQDLLGEIDAGYRDALGAED